MVLNSLKIKFTHLLQNLQPKQKDWLRQKQNSKAKNTPLGTSNLRLNRSLPQSPRPFSQNNQTQKTGRNITEADLSKKAKTNLKRKKTSSLNK
jgi:hypothetical protein